MTGERPAPVPPITPETAAFWDATEDGRLRLMACADCGRVYHYPRGRCPACASPTTDWMDAAGSGTVYSYTVTRQTSGDYADATPYVLAYVELDEGPRILTNVVDCDIDMIRIGSPVTVVFDDTGAGPALPRFTLESGE